MSKLRNTLLEAGVLIVLGAAVGLGSNTLRTKRLRLGTDHFRVERVFHAAEPGLGETGEQRAAPVEENGVPNPGVVEVSLDEVIAYFNDPEYLPGSSDTRYLFIDARDDDSYLDGHIPGAIQVDHYFKRNYLPDVLPMLDTVDKVIVYCNGGTCGDSKLVCGDLLAEGVPAEKILLFLGGWEAWQGANQPAETGGY